MRDPQEKLDKKKLRYLGLRQDDLHKDKHDQDGHRQGRKDRKARKERKDRGNPETLGASQLKSTAKMDKLRQDKLRQDKLPRTSSARKSSANWSSARTISSRTSTSRMGAARDVRIERIDVRIRAIQKPLEVKDRGNPCKP